MNHRERRRSLESGQQLQPVKRAHNKEHRETSRKCRVMAGKKIISPPPPGEDNPLEHSTFKTLIVIKRT